MYMYPEYRNINYETYKIIFYYTAVRIRCVASLQCSPSGLANNNKFHLKYKIFNMELKITFDKNKTISKILFSEGEIKDLELPIDPEDCDFDDLYDIVDDIINKEI